MSLVIPKVILITMYTKEKKGTKIVHNKKKQLNTKRGNTEATEKQKAQKTNS